LYGANRLIRNLTTSEKRKVPRKNIWIENKPELILFDNVINTLKLTREQLIDMGILIGTDYNKGLKKVGPKTALKLIKEHKTLENVLKIKDASFDYPIDEIRNIFLKPETNIDFDIEEKEVYEKKIINLLCDEHQFSLNRVQKGLERINESRKEKNQTTLDFF
ncbi:MAG: flap endonuclease-1, partial [Candidatus Ranarchaeia archaeon]